MKILLQRAGLLLFGLTMAALLVEVIARSMGLADPPDLDGSFDRSPALFFTEPGRHHPWSAGGEDELNIVVIGDSFTAGDGVQKDDAYPARLERLLNLNADAPPAIVRAYARNGTSTADQLKYMRRALEDPPDLIILGIFLNDPETTDMSQWRVGLQPREPTGWKLRVLQISDAAAWIYQRVENARIQRAWMDYMRNLYDPDFPGWKRFIYALETFATTTREAGVPLVAIVLPPAGSLDRDYPFDFAHERIHQALEQQEIPYRDLLEIFRGHSGYRLSVLPGLDGHFNEIGNRMVAEALFGWLLQSGHIPMDYNPNLSEPTPVKQWRTRLQRSKATVPR